MFDTENNWHFQNTLSEQPAAISPVDVRQTSELGLIGKYPNRTQVVYQKRKTL